MSLCKSQAGTGIVWTQLRQLKQVQSRHVPIALEKSPKRAQKIAKSVQIVLEFLKGCFKFRDVLENCS